MASIAPFVPGVEIHTQYVRATTPQTANLAAYIFGPAAEIVRYEDELSRPNGRIGPYDSTFLSGAIGGYVSTNWPNLPTGAEIDGGFTRLHAHNGRLRYFQELDANELTAETQNVIRHDSLLFQSSPTHSASSVFGDRGVRVGDRIRLAGVDTNSDPFELHTYVMGFTGPRVTPGGTGAAPASTNAATQLIGQTVTAGSGNSGDVTATASAASFSGLQDGQLSDAYTLEVIQGGLPSAARLRVTTASGRDQVASLTPAAFGSPTVVGNKGLEVTFASTDEFVVGDTWTIAVDQAYTEPVLDFIYSYAPTDNRDREYLVEVIAGGTDSSGNPMIRVSELTGLDVSSIAPVYQGGVFSPMPIGSYGVVLDDVTAAQGLAFGDKWVVTVKASVIQEYDSLILAHGIPADVAIGSTAADLSLELYLAGDFEIPAHSSIPGVYNFESNDFELRIADNIQLEVPEWTVSGSPVALPLVVPEGTTDTSVLHVTYRGWLPTSATLLSFQDPNDIATLVGGPLGDPDNPLKYALGKAGLVSDGTPVYFFNTGNPNDLNNWSAALAAADGTRETYGFVPLSRSTAVLDMVAGYVNARSGPLFNMPRCLWLTADVPTINTVVAEGKSSDGEVVYATIGDNPLQSGNQYTQFTVTSGNSDFVTQGVRPGDMVRFNFATDVWGDETYDELIVSQVINETTLITTVGLPAPETIARRIEIHRRLTPGERVEAFRGNIDIYTGDAMAGQLGSGGRYPGQLYRVLPFGKVLDGGVEVDSYHMAATLAAFRGVLAPHQSMTRLAVPGFTGTVGIEGLSTTELNDIAAAGGFLVTRDIRTGQMVVRHGVTAGNFDDVNLREESVQANVASVTLYLFQVADPYIGQSNATDETLAMLDAELASARGFLRSANYSPGLGGQLIDLQVVDRRRSPVAKDALIFVVEVTVPGPTNKIRIDLLVI